MAKPRKKSKKKSGDRDALYEKLDLVIERMSTKDELHALNEKVDRVIDEMATKDDIARLEKRMDGFDERLKRVITALEHVKSGFDRMTLEYAAISAKLERYERWFKILEEKTGVKLPI